MIQNDEIGVAGGQAQPFKQDCAGHGQVDDLRMRSILQNGLLEPSGILAETRVVLIRTPRLHHCHKLLGSDKTSDVIHMPVGIISRNAFLQPNGMSDPQIALEQSFIVFLPKSRIADLHRWMKQTLLRGYQGTFAIHIDRTSFQHDSTAAMHGLDHG